MRAREPAASHKKSRSRGSKPNANKNEAGIRLHDNNNKNNNGSSQKRGPHLLLLLLLPVTSLIGMEWHLRWESGRERASERGREKSLPWEMNSSRLLAFCTAPATTIKAVKATQQQQSGLLTFLLLLLLLLPSCCFCCCCYLGLSELLQFHCSSSLFLLFFFFGSVGRRRISNKPNNNAIYAKWKAPAAKAVQIATESEEMEGEREKGGRWVRWH